LEGLVQAGTAKRSQSGLQLSGIDKTHNLLEIVVIRGKEKEKIKRSFGHCPCRDPIRSSFTFRGVCQRR
jgi:hypothetical protein